MPRKAREKIPYGTYLIHQSCISGNSLFESDEDRLKFLKILMDKKNQFHFKIYGYCLASESSYKLVIYDNGSDISKIMKSINISYAYRIRERGKIFKQRYKSSLIRSPKNLRDILDNLHDEKPCCDYKKSFSEDLLDEGIYSTPFDGNQDSPISFSSKKKPCTDSNPLCMDRKDCIRSLEQGRTQLEKAAEGMEITVEQLLSNKQLRNRELLKFRKMTTLSLREIGIIFGGLGESAVCKIISRNNEKMKGE